jgi:Xaa-Pro aminopeptidase
VSLDPEVDRFDYGARIERAAAATTAAGYDALVITHLPNLLYLSGLESSSAAGLLTSEGRLYLITDFRYSAAVTGRAAQVGARLVPVVAESGAWAPAAAERVAADGVRALAVEGDSVTLAASRRLEAACHERGWTGELATTGGIVEMLRRVKDPAELVVLRDAAARLSDVARAVIRDGCVAVGRSEHEVAADVDHRMRWAGFSRPAFETMVASGPNSAYPHARPTSRRLEAGDPVVLDFGGVFRRYCVDLTRTFCLGVASAALDRMFEAVFTAHAAACAAVRPGASGHRVDAAARDVLTAAGYGEAFGHATGHGLGLEVHEAPRLGKRRPGAEPEPELEAGVVCTIEPGAYVPGVGGIRLEDDVAVTPAGHELLTDVPPGWSADSR